MTNNAGNMGLERIVSDYRTEFNDKVTELFDNIYLDTGLMIPRTERINNCDNLLKNYYLEYKEYPAGFVLERMASYILKKDNRGRKGFKMERDGAYPTLSDSQMKARLSRESNLGQAFNVDNKGVDHTPPTRTERINKELSKRHVKLC